MASHGKDTTLFDRVRRIHIQSRCIASEYMSGQFRSAFRGAGMEFHEVRPYREGDPVDRIDWNVTARTGALHVKTFLEERERCVFFLVDTSASTAFGSGKKSKSEIIAELCALLGCSALLSNDRVGLMLFSDAIEKYLPPRRGAEQSMLLIRTLLGYGPTRRGTSIANALEQLMRLRHRRAVVFLVSDFLDAGFEHALGLAARKHDLIAVRVRDPREAELSGRGIASLHDLENGREAIVDLADPASRDRFRSDTMRFSQDLRKTCLSKGVDLLELSCHEDFLAPLRSFLEQRIQRRAR